jgi:hypothetical protein
MIPFYPEFNVGQVVGARFQQAFYDQTWRNIKKDDDFIVDEIHVDISQGEHGTYDFHVTYRILHVKTGTTHRFNPEDIFPKEESKFSDFYEAYEFLENHIIFDERRLFKDIPYAQYTEFKHSLDISVVKVDPTTNCVAMIDEYTPDDEKNTKVRIWLEHGPPYHDVRQKCFNWSHDIDLDCGGDTFEEAIVALANNVYKKYGETNNEKAYDICVKDQDETQD